MRFWHTILFDSELDMLQCLLEELDGSPAYRIVLAEAPCDHRGRPKPLYFAENRERFAPWADRIVHVVARIPGPDARLSPWARIGAQRNALYQGLEDAAPDDYVLLADVDEIPCPAAVEAALTPAYSGVMSAWMMRLAMFAVDWTWPDEARIAVGGPRRALEDLGRQRDNGYRAGLPVLQGAGWHFTWLGGPGAIAEKAERICHLELCDMITAGNREGEWYEQGWTWHGQAAYPPSRRVTRLQAAEVDERWPAYIRERRCPALWFRPR